MLIYKYSGTLDGLLSAVFDIYSVKRLPDNIVAEKKEYQCGLETEVIETVFETAKTERVKQSIIKYIGAEGLHDIEKVFRTEESNKEMIIFGYLRLMYKHGRIVRDMRNDASVIAFEECVSRVGYEIHRMEGFLRFSVLSNGILYAEYEPDNDITEYLLPYFAQRNNIYSLIIRDKKRNIYGLYNGTTTAVVTSSDIPDTPFSEEEAFFRTLWEQYFETVSIAERKNKRLQDGFMPRRYRKNMCETQKSFL